MHPRTGIRRAVGIVIIALLLVAQLALLYLVVDTGTFVARAYRSNLLDWQVGWLPEVIRLASMLACFAIWSVVLLAREPDAATAKSARMIGWLAFAAWFGLVVAWA